MRAVSTWSDLPQDSTTVTASSTSPARYRYDILNNAKIIVHHVTPPKDIQSQVNAIFNRRISKERRSEISSIAKGMCNEFIAITQANRREDDCVEVVITALETMDKEKVFAFVRKAGITPFNSNGVRRRVLTLEIDWDPNLNPDPPQLFNFKHLGHANNEADYTAERPTKRQRREWSSNPSSDQSLPDAPASERGQHKGVKTPRPDCTIGLSHSTLAHALSERVLKTSQADGFLRGLQREHILYSDPTENFMNVRFPVLVVEGKAYATGKTVFEAENQAAVAGSCMVNLLQQLTDVHDRCVPDSPHMNEAPLTFSISTWGPLLQFWVHYPLVEDNITSYHMSVLKTCHACIADELEDFLLMSQQLMSWNKDDFLTKITRQLFAVAKRTPYRK